MHSLFGISMNLIMYVLVVMLGVSLGSVAFVALRNPIMFKMGIRSIPRRRAQTTLVVVGLMLSTVIISAAFTTGDTVDRSITSQVYDILGSDDEQITVRLPGDDEDTIGGAIQSIFVQTSFDQTQAETLVKSLAGNPQIDYAIPAYSGVAASENVDKENHLGSLLNVVGLDPARTQDLPDIQELDSGRVLSLMELGAGEIFLNESAAFELDVGAGDSVTIHAFGRTVTYRIKALVRDKRLAGAGGITTLREGALLPLAAAQELFNVPGQITVIAISNKGDARGGLTHADDIEVQIKDAIDGWSRATPNAPTLGVTTIKRTGVDIAETGANILTTFFLVLGLFSIGAGALLIFMIFVMLAAERKSEMGMARAVGTRRADIVQTFLSEGMGYNVISALVGTGLGVLVAFVMAKIMASVLSSLDISINPYVTARSLIISYSLGVVLTFLTVTFASWRVSYINIVRAIRDIPEPPALKPLWRTRGFFPTLKRLIFKPGTLKQVGARLGLLLIAFVLWSASVPSDSTLVRILGGLTGAIFFLSFVFLTFQMSMLFVVASIPLIILGVASSNAFALLFGLSLLPLGLALTIRSFGANERAIYTTAGLVLLYIWEFDFSVGLIDRVFGKTDGGIELFFLSGVMVTVAATFVVVYNSDVILGPITKIGRGFGALVPSLKMAVAYPLANRMRTGMTMAMFCLVVFALTVMSSMNHNFNRLYLSDRALGGWDVLVEELPTNPITDLRASLASANSPAASQVKAVGYVSIAARSHARTCEIDDTHSCSISGQPGSLSSTDFHEYLVAGDDGEFLSAQQLPLQARGNGYGSDTAVWQAVASDPLLAVVDSTALASGGGGFGPTGFISGIDAGDSQFEPVSIVVADRTTGKSQTVKVIGVVELGASANFGAVHLNQRTFDAIYGRSDFRRIYVKTTPGADNNEVARQIESALIVTGAQAESLRHQLEQQNSTQSGFFYLMQGFMGLGLFVGVAAVGVIAFRTVVERRQQIGMLRALGYTRGMIGLTFLLESSFIAFMGVLSGIVFALILARQLITQEFAKQGVHTFAVPWWQIGVIGGLAFGAAVLMTLIPSRQAARIPIAEALRYE